MELLNKWEELISIIENELLNSTIRVKSPSEILAISFYCTTVQISASILLFYKNKRFHSTPILMRSQLEAFVDMSNLLNDANYYYILQANDLKEKIKINREYKNNPQNPYLSKMSMIDNYDKKVAELLYELEQLKIRGFEPISIFQKFEKNQSLELYRSVYILLCQHTHNNVASMESRHIYFDDKEKPHLTLMNDNNFKGYYPFIDTNFRTLIKGFIAINELLLLNDKENTIESLNSFLKYLQV